MSQFTTRANRLMTAVESYKNNFKRWDTLHLVPKIKITSAGNGHMEGTFEVTEEMCNCGTALHGGFTSSVIDYFTVYSAMQHPKGCLAWTTDMNVSYYSDWGKGAGHLKTCEDYQVQNSDGMYPGKREGLFAYRQRHNRIYGYFAASNFLRRSSV